MTLTKEDLKAIEKISEGVATRQTGNLAAMVAKQFSRIDKRFDQIDKRFEQIDAQFRSVNARLDRLELDVANLTEIVKEMRIILNEAVTWEEHKRLEKRILRLERHLGLSTSH